MEGNGYGVITSGDGISGNCSADGRLGCLGSGCGGNCTLNHSIGGLALITVPWRSRVVSVGCRVVYLGRLRFRMLGVALVRGPGCPMMNGDGWGRVAPVLVESGDRMPCPLGVHPVDRGHVVADEPVLTRPLDLG